MSSSALYPGLRYNVLMRQTTPNERLKQARKRAGFGDMRQMCAQFGWPYESYKKHEGKRKVDPEMVPHYARAFGVEPGWILWGVNPPSWEKTSASMRPRANFRSVPKLTAEQAMQMPQLFGKLRNQCPETVITHSSDIGPHAFALEIEDDSMVANPVDRDSFAPGDEVIFDPDREPKPGQFVLAHIEGEPKAIFRKYRLRGSVNGVLAYELFALNTNYGIEKIGPDGRHARIIGLMVRHIKKY